MIRFWSISAWLGATALVLLTCVGCPDGGAAAAPTAHLQGTVTLNGAPVPANATGSIVFDPIDSNVARAASADIIDGKYDVPDAPLGKVNVVINITQPTNTAPPDDRGAIINFKSLVPQELWDGQEIQVDGDKPDLDFDLK